MMESIGLVQNKPPKLPGEKWRRVTYNANVYKQFYRISNLARIWSNGRILRFKRTRNGVTLNIVSKLHADPQLLTPTLDNNGYHKVSLIDAVGFRRTCFLHQLIMYEFVGPCPVGKEVRHRDGVKTNYSLINLRYSSKKTNGRDRVKHGHQVKGEEVVISKLTEQQVRKIRRLYATYNYKFSQPKLATKYGVSQHTISQVVNRKTWKHVK
jgi:hypothetical protein